LAIKLTARLANTKASARQQCTYEGRNEDIYSKSTPKTYC